jgi:hypothetical protein
MVIRRAQIVDGFLDWLVAHQHIDVNPFAELRARCTPRGTRSIVTALLSADPDVDLERLCGLPRFGSCFGPVLRAYVKRMRTLGYKYEEGRFLRFDHFVQQRPGAEAEPLPALIRAYMTAAGSPACQIERLKVGRILTRELDRTSTHPKRSHGCSAPRGISHPPSPRSAR